MNEQQHECLAPHRAVLAIESMGDPRLSCNQAGHGAEGFGQQGHAPWVLGEETLMTRKSAWRPSFATPSE